MRYLRGVAASEGEDQQGEELIQEALDWSYFREHGVINDNHEKSTAKALGRPLYVEKFQEGDILPDETIAQYNCTWLEGFMLDTPLADAVWEACKALLKAGRHIGFSVQGNPGPRAGNKILGGEVIQVSLSYEPVHRYALVRNMWEDEEPFSDDMAITGVYYNDRETMEKAIGLKAERHLQRESIQRGVAKEVYDSFSPEEIKRYKETIRNMVNRA